MIVLIISIPILIVLSYINCFSNRALSIEYDLHEPKLNLDNLLSSSTAITIDIPSNNSSAHTTPIINLPTLINLDKKFELDLVKGR